MQRRNRAQAWTMLRRQALYERAYEIKKREAQAMAEQAAKTDIGWGHQIPLLYVLQPYQMVKDLRTGVQTSNTGAVLDGDLDEFMGRGAGAEGVRGGAEEDRGRRRSGGGGRRWQDCSASILDPSSPASTLDRQAIVSLVFSRSSY